MVLQAFMSLQRITAAESGAALFACIGLVGQMLGLVVAAQIVLSDKVPSTVGFRTPVRPLAIVRVQVTPEVKGARKGLITTFKSARMHPLFDRLALSACGLGVHG